MRTRRQIVGLGMVTWCSKYPKGRVPKALHTHTHTHTHLEIDPLAEQVLNQQSDVQYLYYTKLNSKPKLKALDILNPNTLNQ